MLSIRTATGYLVRLDPGEEVRASLTTFLEREGVGGATISGIGAVRDATLGYYDGTRGEYLRRELAGDHEVCSFSGNLAWVEGKPFLHAHVVLSGADFATVGGHLFEATIAATGEFWVTTLGARVERTLDQARGLKLISGAE